jgi:hypothetical protein
LHMGRKISSVHFHSHHEVLGRGGGVLAWQNEQPQGLNIAGWGEARWEAYVYREEKEERTMAKHGYSPFCSKCPLIFCPIFHLRPVP